jgi:protein-disulfide isomerase
MRHHIAKFKDAHIRWDLLKLGLDVVTGVALIALAVTTLHSAITRSAQATSAQRATVVEMAPTTIALSDRAIKHPGATVAIVELSDFECPFCARFAREVFPDLKSQLGALGITFD